MQRLEKTAAWAVSARVLVFGSMCHAQHAAAVGEPPNIDQARITVQRFDSEVDGLTWGSYNVNDPPNINRGFDTQRADILE
ncbi:MAG: hypothetical protein ABGX16_01805 [Pirellulales bacterium]